MKALLWVIALIVVGVAGFYLFNAYIYNEKQEENGMSNATSTTPAPAEIVPIMHATALIKWTGLTIYIDPTGGKEVFAGQPAADIVLLTDIHGDHLSTSTLAAVVATSTTVIAPKAVTDMLPEPLKSRTIVMNNNDSRTEQGFSILALPMYNLPNAENKDRHVKGRGNGYVIERDGFKVYIAGDTAGVPEMRALRDIDIALVPMNLPYTMGVEEAADAVLDFKPRVVYPYHYRSPDGLSDVAKFKQLVHAGDANIEVVLANWYPEN